MDLTQFEQQDSFDHTLVAPNGEKTDIIFTLAGPTHPVRAAFEKKQTARGLREFNKKGKASLPDDPDDIVDNLVERLTQFTLGWENLSMDGEPVVFAARAARDLYSNPRFEWIRAQINAELMDQANFIRSSSSTSSRTSSTASA